MISRAILSRNMVANRLVQLLLMGKMGNQQLDSRFVVHFINYCSGVEMDVRLSDAVLDLDGDC